MSRIIKSVFNAVTRFTIGGSEPAQTPELLPKIPVEHNETSSGDHGSETNSANGELMDFQQQQQQQTAPLASPPVQMAVETKLIEDIQSKKQEIARLQSIDKDLCRAMDQKTMLKNIAERLGRLPLELLTNGALTGAVFYYINEFWGLGAEVNQKCYDEIAKAFTDNPQQIARFDLFADTGIKTPLLGFRNLTFPIMSPLRKAQMVHNMWWQSANQTSQFTVVNDPEHNVLSVKRSTTGSGVDSLEIQLRPIFQSEDVSNEFSGYAIMDMQVYYFHLSHGGELGPLRVRLKDSAIKRREHVFTPVGILKPHMRQRIHMSDDDDDFLPGANNTASSDPALDQEGDGDEEIDEDDDDERTNEQAQLENSPFAHLHDPEKGDLYVKPAIIAPSLYNNNTGGGGGANLNSSLHMEQMQITNYKCVSDFEKERAHLLYDDCLHIDGSLKEEEERINPPKLALDQSELWCLFVVPYVRESTLSGMAQFLYNPECALISRNMTTLVLLHSVLTALDELGPQISLSAYFLVMQRDIRRAFRNHDDNSYRLPVRCWKTILDIAQDNSLIISPNQNNSITLVVEPYEDKREQWHALLSKEDVLADIMGSISISFYVRVLFG